MVDLWIYWDMGVTTRMDYSCIETLERPMKLLPTKLFLSKLIEDGFTQKKIIAQNFKN